MKAGSGASLLGRERRDNVSTNSRWTVELKRGTITVRHNVVRGRHKDLQTASRYVDRRGASSRALKALES